MFVPYGDIPIKNPPDHALLPHLLAYASLKKKDKERKAKFAEDVKKKRTEFKSKRLNRAVESYVNEKFRPQKTVQVRKEGPSIKLMKTQVSKLYNDKKKLVTENNKLKNELKKQIDTGDDWRAKSNKCNEDNAFWKRRVREVNDMSMDFEDKLQECAKKLETCEYKLGIFQKNEELAELRRQYAEDKKNRPTPMPRHRKPRSAPTPKSNTPKSKSNTGGLSSWQAFLSNYRSQNPNMPFRQAQKQAAVLYKQQ